MSCSESSERTADFRVFADRLTQGESLATEELLQRYARRLKALAARRVGGILRSKIDAEDVLQSVFGSFFAQVQAGRILLTNSQNLRGLLALMVIRKVARYTERYFSQGRDLRREKYGNHNMVWNEYEIPDTLPFPDEIVEAAEAWLAGMRRLRTDEREVVESFLLGESTSQIAQRLQCSSRTVQRKLRRACFLLTDNR